MKNIICIIFILIFANNSIGQNWDIELLHDINGSYNSETGAVFKMISESVTPVSIGTPISFLVVSAIKKDKQLLQNGLEIGISELTTGLITYVMKISFRRERPFITYPNLIDKQGKGGSYAFPSGHTSAAFATATALTLIYPKWYVVVPSYAWAIAAGYSRMYLGVHYPSDVIAGAILGSGISVGIHYLIKHIKKRSQERNEEAFL